MFVPNSLIPSSPACDVSVAATSFWWSVRWRVCRFFVTFGEGAKGFPFILENNLRNINDNKFAGEKEIVAKV